MIKVRNDALICSSPQKFYNSSRIFYSSCKHIWFLTLKTQKLSVGLPLHFCRKCLHGDSRKLLRMWKRSGRKKEMHVGWFTALC